MTEGVVAWPADAAQRYRRDGYWRGETLAELLREPARTHGDRIAVVTRSERVCYADLDSRVDRMAAGLRALGI